MIQMYLAIVLCFSLSGCIFYWLWKKENPR
jgi:hypothetical protein